MKKTNLPSVIMGFVAIGFIISFLRGLPRKTIALVAIGLPRYLWIFIAPIILIVICLVFSLIKAIFTYRDY